MNDKQELKACPFCGGKKLKVDSKKSSNFRYDGSARKNHHVVTVRCNKCHCRGSATSVWLEDGQFNAIEIMREMAIEAWNTRHC